MTAIPYQRFAQCLAASALSPSPAEVHGVYCGLICAGHPEPEATWLAEIALDAPQGDLLAEAQTREIARSKVTRVSYVSCDPATFARDAAILVAAGFAIGRLLPVDQFRWSGHVELAAAFSR